MKKILLFLAIATWGAIASADYLFWMVAEDYADESYSDYSATLYAFKANDESVSPVALDTANHSAIAAAWDDDPVVPFGADLATYTEGWSYYVELTNGSKTLSNKDYAVSYGSTAEQYINRGGLSVPSGLTGGFGSQTGTYNVPEPTSGLLFLVGGMLLGLRRKRRV